MAQHVDAMCSTVHKRSRTRRIARLSTRDVADGLSVPLRARSAYLVRAYRWKYCFIGVK